MTIARTVADVLAEHVVFCQRLTAHVDPGSYTLDQCHIVRVDTFQASAR